LRWQAQLATTLNNLAALAAKMDQLDEAEVDYRRALEIQQPLADRAPHVVAYTRDLAVSQNNFGYVLSRQQRFAAAVEQFERARDNLSRLAHGHDQSPEYASRLGAVCNNLGMACENQHLAESAEQAYREAILWQRKSLALSPNWGQAQTYLDNHMGNLVRLLRTTDQRVVEVQGDATTATHKPAIPAELNPARTGLSD
jgi:tetratricopeptide (TPR) repeat protein